MAAPYYVGMSTPVAGGGADSVDITYPAGILLNDLLIALVTTQATVAQTITDYTDGPTGFQLIKSSSLGVLRGVSAYWKAALGTETGSATFTVATSLNLGQVNGTMAIIRDGLTINGIEATGSGGITNSTSVAPASITTTLANELAFACIGYFSTTTCGAISLNSWAECEAEQNDASRSYSLQSVVLDTAQTISGGTATLGASAPWGIITFAVKPKVNLFLPRSVIVG